MMCFFWAVIIGTVGIALLVHLLKPTKKSKSRGYYGHRDTEDQEGESQIPYIDDLMDHREFWK